MNVLAPPKARLTVEVVHDLVCPWCYLGTRRLLRTIRRRPDLLVDLVWRPFLLNPDMPRLGMSRSDYVVRKFGGEDRARRLYASITEIGRAEGVQFRFDRVRRTPSSVDAHRLVRWAARFGRADGVVEALFAAHFADGRDLGDPAVLCAIAASCGLDPAGARPCWQRRRAGRRARRQPARPPPGHQRRAVLRRRRPPRHRRRAGTGGDRAPARRRRRADGGRLSPLRLAGTTPRKPGRRMTPTRTALPALGLLLAFAGGAAAQSPPTPEQAHGAGDPDQRAG